MLPLRSLLLVFSEAIACFLCLTVEEPAGGRTEGYRSSLTLPTLIPSANACPAPGHKAWSGSLSGPMESLRQEPESPVFRDFSFRAQRRAACGIRRRGL